MKGERNQKEVKVSQSEGLSQMKTAISELNSTSEYLCEKLFDLNQKYVQDELKKRSSHMDDVKIVYQRECEKLR